MSSASLTIVALSGGVDSAVTAALLHKAIGDQLVRIFVDNGLLRKNERQGVEDLGVVRHVSVGHQPRHGGNAIALRQELDLPHRRDAFPPEDFVAADEAFLTSTLKGVLPIRSIDGKSLPAPVPGPLTTRLAEAYRTRTEGEDR